jgi:hypothetical protein
MANCTVHPGSASVGKLNGVDVCQKCKDEIVAARKKVDKHVEPKDCFVWYEGSRTGWQPIPGTGCAHWVSHQRGWKRGSKNEQCMLGHTFRVKTMLGGLSEVKKIADVKVNDVYATPSKDHTGLVIKVTPDPKKPDEPKITIRHDSSNQGKVADNEFATYFKGKGSFYR